MIVADDHPIVLVGIRRMLDGLPDIQIVATAGTTEELVAVLTRHTCDVLICDFTFNTDASQDGIRLIERLLHLHPSVRIILLTVHEELMLVQRVLEMGVAGFIGKSSSTLEGLPLAIRAVYGGGLYLDPAISRMLSDRLLRKSPEARVGNPLSLTKKEFEVVRLLVRGMSVTDIARETGRSIKTISTQKVRALKKLGARNDSELGERFRDLWGRPHEE
ncbi:response regulator transcription factor [Burkholderia contaminans]|uniref:response regulator transcription factor n=1 Tax=Burkholderia contaminans TaxID=488447 RepID=UPI00158E8265|nr:response regulator transcription factor [Burkholderia contaminans]